MVDLEAGLVEREAVGVGPAADRDEHASASIVSAAPPLAGSTVSVALPPLTFTPVTLVPSRNSMPCFLKILLASLRTSSSKPGRIWSRNSTQVTFAPTPPPDAAQLEPDHAAADHDEMVRHLVQLQRACRRNDDFLVDSTPGQRRHG